MGNSFFGNFSFVGKRFRNNYCLGSMFEYPTRGRTRFLYYNYRIHLGDAVGGNDDDHNP